MYEIEISKKKKKGGGGERKMEKLILLPESERLYFRMVTLAEWENQFKKKKGNKKWSQ